MTNEWQKNIRPAFFYTFWGLITFLAAILRPDLFIPTVQFKVGYNAYPNPGPLFLFSSIFFFTANAKAFLILFSVYKNVPVLRKQQFMYIFISFLVGFSGGIMMFLPVYDIMIPPYGIFLVPVFLGVSTWITIRYQLLDVRLFVSRAILLFVVYLFILGLPLGFAFLGRGILEYVLGVNWWMGPLFLSFLLATAGPFISVYFIRQAEQGLLRQETLYQNVLLQLAFKLNQVKDVKFLSSLMVHVLTYSLKVDKASLYIFQDDEFFLSAYRDRRKDKASVYSIPEDSFLMQHLNKNPAPILVDEVLLRGRDYNDKFLISLSRELDQMAASLVLPCWVGNKLVGIIALGAKKSKRMFSAEDITILSVLAGQAGMAISHALYVENLNRARESLIESEKMATIGFLVGGLAHQLKNRFTSFVFFSDFVFRKVSACRGAVLPAEECDEALSYLEKITAGVHSSKEIVNGVLNYASDRETKGDVSMKALVAATIELIEFKIPPGSVVFENAIKDEASVVKGNLAQLQEVIFNIMDNAFHAMMEKKSAGVEADYVPKLSFSSVLSGNMLRITIVDNGMGVRPENMRKLFTPLFSTKKADKKGHGLGLYVMRQIIEKNHGGKIAFESEYTKGVTIEMYLPAVVSA